MISALWTGISGLSAHQTALDNESNNIANVNTVGYKASRVTFADQMYQDSIGKGSKVEMAEKQYVQGNLNVTGNEYDMALNGDGFFVVSNMNRNGTSETYYTRSGNFRMGENGTLQDSMGNEVQGWAMSPLDTQSDVITTNSNVTSFNENYTKMAGNQIIQFPNKVVTYAAKTTDYQASAKGDPLILTGSGVKSQSTKISEVEALTTNYNNALNQYALNPEGPSTPSITKTATIDFPDGSDNLLMGEGDQLTVYIDGNKITQNYVSTTATTEFKAIADDSLTMAQRDLNGDGTVSDSEYNILASRDATTKALSDKISDITGLIAYTVDGANNPSTSLSDTVSGKIKIDSIIPGEDFVIGDVAVVSGTLDKKGINNTITEAVQGTGEAAVQSALEALEKAVAGNQRDLYQSNDIFSGISGGAIPMATGDELTYTLNGTSVNVVATATDTEESLMKKLAATINSDATLQEDLEAKMINGQLVIESKKVGQEFSSTFEFTDASAGSTYQKNKNLDLSISSGAGAEFMQIVSTVDQNASQSSLQLNLNTLGLTDSAFGEFSVNENGLIVMKQDGVEFAIGQVAIAQFNNNIGLNPVGDNLLEKTNTSGEPLYTTNNRNSAKIESETLELSTADLSESLVNLMVFQRAFEANSKSITTADQILNTLIQLKR